jgi:hypothetical protein
MVVKGEAGLHEQQPKTAKGRPISDFRQPRDQLNGQNDSPTGRDTYSFSGGDQIVVLLQMMMMR